MKAGKNENLLVMSNTLIFDVAKEHCLASYIGYYVVEGSSSIIRFHLSLISDI